MAPASRRTLGIILAIAVVAGALLLLSWLVPSIRAEARTLAGSDGLRGLGSLGVVLAGLAAPIVFLFGKLSKGLAGLLPDSDRENEIREDNKRIEAELASVRAEVARIDRERRQELDQGWRRVAALEAKLGVSQGARSDIDAQIEHLKAQPPPERSTQELIEMLEKGEGYVALYD
jgi:hypothetical protein